MEDIKTNTRPKFDSHKHNAINEESAVKKQTERYVKRKWKINHIPSIILLPSFTNIPINQTAKRQRIKNKHKNQRYNACNSRTNPFTRNDQ